MSDVAAVFFTALAPATLPLHIAAPIMAACMLVAAWRSMEVADSSRATRDAVERSRTALGVLGDR